jgi:hypothetical protein
MPLLVVRPLRRLLEEETVIGGLMNLLKPKRQSLRCFYNGTEIDKLVPPLSFLDADDWFEQWMKWLADKEWKEMYIITDKDPALHHDAVVHQVWAGPPLVTKIPDDMHLKIYERQ